MMKRLFFLIFVILWPIAAASQPVQVRSGEHDDFTRLVLYLPSGVEAQVAPTAIGADITTSRPVEYDLSGVYARINRERFADVAQSTTRDPLRLSFDCACRLRSETLVGNVLVLDLVDDPAVTRPAAAEPTAVAAPKPMAPPPPKPTIELPLKNLLPRPSLQEARRVAESVTSTFPEPMQESDENRIERLARIEREIIESIANTATQGLLDIADPGLPSDPAQNETSDEQSTGTPQETPLPPAAPQGGAKLHTALIDAPTKREPVTSDGVVCLDDDLNIASWNDGTGFVAELGQKRAGLTGEFDRVDDRAVRSLAKFLLSYGFGIEALNTLDMLSKPKQSDAILRSIGQILDHGYDPDPSPFDHQLDCDSSAAFWAVLANKPIPRDAQVAVSAVLRTMNEMPAPLRTALGPEVADRLLDYGDAETSRAIVRILQRGQAPETSEQTLVTAKVELTEGDDVAGQKTLEEVIEKADENSPEALIALVQDRLARGETIEPSQAELLGAYVVQFRQSPLATALVETEIRARAASGQYDTANSLIDLRIEESLISESVASLRDEVTSRLLIGGSDQDLLRLGLDLWRQHPDDLRQSTKVDLAKRFLSMGFAELAMDILDTDSLNKSNELQIVRAQAALAAGRPQRAEAELIGVRGEEADAIRAQAQVATGDHDAAARTFSNLNDQQAAEENAWRAGQWDQLANSDDSLKAALSTLMRAEEQEPPAEMGELARNRRLLQDTSAARQTIQDMLNRYSVSETN